MVHSRPSTSHGAGLHLSEAETDWSLTPSLPRQPCLPAAALTPVQPTPCHLASLGTVQRPRPPLCGPHTPRDLHLLLSFLTALLSPLPGWPLLLVASPSGWSFLTTVRSSPPPGLRRTISGHWPLPSKQHCHCFVYSQMDTLRYILHTARICI